jgi:serine/threonine-protein kinase RsbW
MPVSSDEGAVLEIRISPDPALVATVRAVASDIAGRADFDLDAISDLQMAVEEASAIMIGLADRAGMVTCAFSPHRDHVQIRVSARVAHVGAQIDTTSFGWRVLGTLVDQLTVEPEPDDARGMESTTLAISLIMKSS